MTKINKAEVYVAAILLFLLILVIYLKSWLKAVILALRLPGPTPLPFIGNAALITDSKKLMHIGNICYKEYGGIFRVWVSVMPMIFIIEPKCIQTIIGNNKHNDKSFIYTLLHNFIGDGLISSNGIRWKRHRKLIQPFFHINMLQLYVSRFSKSAELRLSKLNAVVNTEMNITSFINDCVLDILHDTVLGIPLDDIVLKSQSPFRKGVITLPTRIKNPWFLIESLYQLTTAAKNELKQKSKLQAYTKKILENRRETTSGIEHSLVDAFIEIAKSNPEFTDDDIVSELSTFMLAGQDSVAAAVAFALYYLAKHQDVQERACSELQTIFGDSDRSAGFEDLNRMKYLEQCVKETLRLCPSVPIFSRTLSDDVALDNCTLPAGCNILISPYVTHRLPHIYEDPENFEPERFASENCEDLHPFAYLPFSAGPRNCIGFKFGLLEIKAILATFLRAYKFSLCPKRDFSFLYRVTLRAKGGIWLRLQKK